MGLVQITYDDRTYRRKNIMTSTPLAEQLAELERMCIALGGVEFSREADRITYIVGRAIVEHRKAKPATRHPIGICTETRVMLPTRSQGNEAGLCYALSQFYGGLPAEQKPVHGFFSAPGQ